MALHLELLTEFCHVRNLPNLRISPMGAVPQRERHPRIIVDYSFSNVNQEAEKGAPPEAMQLGQALNRILHHIVTVDPAEGPVYLSKLDLADGFYWVPLRDSDIPLLGVAFPSLRESPLWSPYPWFFPWVGPKAHHTFAARPRRSWTWPTT